MTTGSRLLRLRWLSALLAVLLLFAQYGALTHALGHAGVHTHATAGAAAHDTHGHDAGSQEETPTRNLFGSCAFDLVYSQVLGGLHGSHDLVFAAAEHVLVVTAAFAVRSSVTAVPYDSRGPPAVS